MLENLSQIVDEYFVRPLAQPETIAPYNWVNTLAFALVALVAVGVIFKVLKKLRVPVDEKFFWAVVPFVLFGGALRAVVDANILPREVVLGGVTLYPLVTPGIYIVTFLLLVLVMAVAWWKAKGNPTKREFTQTLKMGGSLLAVLALLPLLPLLKHFPQALMILALGVFGVLVFEGLERMRGKKVGELRNLERLLVFGQAFDGAATFVGVGLGVPGLVYSEQHVVGNLVFGALGGPGAFYALKVLFALVVILVLRKELAKPKERELGIYLLLLITILGLAPGVRDFLRITAGV